MKQFFAVEKQNGSVIQYFYTYQEALNYVNYLDEWGYWDLNIREVK